VANRRIVDPLTPAAPFHHLGILTPDIEAAIDFLSPTLGVTFRDPITVTSLRVDPDEFGNAAAHPVEGRISFSIEGPPHYELAEGHGRMPNRHNAPTEPAVVSRQAMARSQHPLGAR